MKEKIAVLIIDKQKFFRDGLKYALSEWTDFKTSDTDLSNDLLGIIETSSADVLLMDIDFPSFSGLELCRRVKLLCPNVRVIMLSPNFDNDELFETTKAGGVAYLDKKTNAEELATVIRQAYSGEYPINDSILSRPKVAERVLKQFQDMTSMGRPLEAISAPLTHRETQILMHISEGKSNKQIAGVLEISEQTIKNHVSSILRKLNANDRAHAAVLAIRRGWISAEEKTS